MATKKHPKGAVLELPEPVVGHHDVADRQPTILGVLGKLAVFVLCIFFGWFTQSQFIIRLKNIQSQMFPSHDDAAPRLDLGTFYSSVKENDLCRGPYGNLTSFSGHIGLNGDSDDDPKRSFFWYFQAQEDHENAPVILTFGGGPGSSGLFNPLSGQSPCRIAANGTIEFNPYAWTTKYNLLALDHPIGVGFSYGQHVNNSEDAAADVYGFLQKIFTIFPYLARNKLVLAGGSYGGIYVPTIATEIHEQNKAIATGHGLVGAQHLNLEALLVSNPITDIISYFEWILYYRCELHEVYNSTTCSNLYRALPGCLSALDIATSSVPSIENKVAATKLCSPLDEADTHGTVVEDIRRKCTPDSSGSTLACAIPTGGWLADYLGSNETKSALGVPLDLDWTVWRKSVGDEFAAHGDIVRRGHLLYEPLLADGIRLLHYIGIQDANCAWPGTLAFLKLIRSPFQADFIAGADVPWEGHNATVRVVGPGAGNMTYALVDGAGHFVIESQTKLVRELIGHFIDNIPFM
ncbi:alpha/beta-hydrolase [Clavulina sp. PMI_390]|nr:alpha/beta-hydrolase [Clavulina sp. PMI_390]